MNRREFLVSAGAAPLAASVARAGHAASEKRSYRMCVIGDTNQGKYGHNLHMAWGGREDVAVVGLADPDVEGRRKAAAEAKAERSYADYREMLDTEKPDLVTVGPRWSIHHKEYLLAAVEAGAHGLIEKPLATDLAEGDAMLDAAARKNLKWCIAFNFRATAEYLHAKRLILEEKIIGDVLELRGRGKEDRRAGGEDLIVLGTHVFDMMIDLVGRPRWCSADIQANGRPATKDDVREATESLGPVVGDRLQATYGFANGVHGHFASMGEREGDGPRWGLEVHGSKGIVRFEKMENPRVHLFRTHEWAPGEETRRWEPLPGAPEAAAEGAHRHAPVVDELIDAIESDREPAVSLRDGLDAYEMIQAVFAAHVNGGHVKMPLVEREHPLKRWRSS